ncbi:hypothetical protein F3J38_03310 [Pantoea sp. Acro-805]|jgi:hypothetical protein|uniref:Uncharacterized protein n=1 Tax=Candidatus Pantoea formicae TaxID=2608355 RepID=A0ABX0QTN4_9GAMM|nr:hypothetical protein [Pantoea formicae]MDF7647771.1 hypothetical protein [Erwiniaceae bacterium L1_54_3]NIE99107.1 hypothetical protein [Pantoea formicae]
MRDFDMRGHHRGHSFGGHRMIKPLLIGAVIIAALGLLVMSLWNAILPAIIGVKSIGFWQAIGLLVLCRILFGGLGFRPGMFGMARRRMHERWMQMTPEQREEFMQHRRERFHHGRRERCDWHGRRDEARSQHDENTPKSPEAE